MDIRPIKTEQDYNTIAIVSAIKRIEELWGSKKDTSNGDELDLLVTLVESYDKGSTKAKVVFFAILNGMMDTLIV